MSATTVRLLLARFHDDDVPVVLTAVDRSIWEHREEAEDEQWKKEAQEMFGCDPSDYELREAWATFDTAALNEAFKTVEVAGEVTPA